MKNSGLRTAPASACELHAAYAAGTLTPTQATEHCLQAACESPSVFTRITAERALEEARQSTQRWRTGRPLGPLDGVPISWKDLFDVRGTPTTAASALLRSAPPAPADAPVVARAAAAGMVCLGKTNLSEFAYSGLGLNPGFGTPANPRLGGRARAPGGSSSGAALAVVQGCGPLAMGTDTAGSVRIPAAFNGLVGFRASRGRYPMQGVFALSPSLDTLGPLALGVADCMALDQVLRSTVPAGDAAAGPAVPGPVIGLQGQVFVIDPGLLDDDRVQAQVRDAIAAGLALLQRQGARVQRRRLQSLDTVQTLTQRHGWLGAHEALATHRERLDAPEQAARMDPRVRSRLAAARHLDHGGYLQLLARRQPLMALFAQELGGATLVLPTVGHPAPLLQPLLEDDALFAQTNLATLHLTMPGSFLDAPAVALPCGALCLQGPGASTERLPIGLQLMRPQGDDDRLLRIALAVEQALSSLNRSQ